MYNQRPQNNSVLSLQFLWDKIIHNSYHAKYEDGVLGEEEKKHLLNIAYDIQAYPIFTIKTQEVFDVLEKLGDEVLKGPSPDALAANFMLPYPTTFCALDTAGIKTMYKDTDDTASNFELRQFLFWITHDSIKNIFTIEQIGRFKRKGSSVYELLVGYDGIKHVIDLNAEGDTLNKKIYGLTSKISKFGARELSESLFIGTWLLVGLLTTLKAKQILKIEEVMPYVSIPNFVPYSRNRITVKSHAYKELSLDIRGQEYVEYLKEKAAGEKQSRASSRCHWCRGHFKLRKGKLYWWNAHLRNKKAKTVLAKDYNVTI